MEPQALMQSIEFNDNLNSLSPKTLRKMYQKNSQVISKIAAKKLKCSSSKEKLSDCLLVVNCFREAKKIDQILKGKTRGNSIDELEKKMNAIAKNVNLGIAIDVEQQADLVDLNRYQNDEIIQKVKSKFSKRFFRDVLIDTVSFPRLINDNYKPIFAKKITFKNIDTNYLRDMLLFCCSLIKPSEFIRDDLNDNPLLEFLYQQLEDEFKLNTIAITVSNDGWHCEIRLGQLMVITNSDHMAPGDRQKICCVDLEAIEEILKDNDVDSKTSHIPILRGFDSMGIKVIEYLGLRTL